MFLGERHSLPRHRLAAPRACSPARAESSPAQQCVAAGTRAEGGDHKRVVSKLLNIISQANFTVLQLRDAGAHLALKYSCAAAVAAGQS